MREIEAYLYEPTGSTWDCGVSKDKCRARATRSGDFFSHQCTRRPVETIDGYGFCKQHASIIRRALKLVEEESDD